MKRVMVAAVLVAAALAGCGSDDTPSGREMKLLEACGPKVAAQFKAIDWYSEEESSDYIAAECLLP